MRIETDNEILARTTTEALLAHHPDHAATIRSCMWMGAEDGVHHYKHRLSRKTFTYDPRNGRIVGELDTGEESDLANEVLRDAAII